MRRRDAKFGRAAMPDARAAGGAPRPRRPGLSENEMLTIAAVALAAVLIWVAATAAAEEDLRARRSQRREALRDLDFKRERHP
jgi:hypothetical protein